MKKTQKEVVNIRLLVSTRDRLKVRAAKEKKTLMTLIDELSRIKICR